MRTDDQYTRDFTIVMAIGIVLSILMMNWLILVPCFMLASILSEHGINYCLIALFICHLLSCAINYL